MWSYVWSGLLRQRSRYLAVTLAVLLPVVSATLLSEFVTAQRLSVHRTVQTNFRGSYDLLVRPVGTRSPIEERSGLVRPDYLNGISGGITLSQWHVIESIPGVTVAAPIEYLGYVLPLTNETIPVSLVIAHPHPNVLYRVSVTPTAHHGLDAWAPQNLYLLLASQATGCRNLFLIPPPLYFGTTGPPPATLSCYAPAGGERSSWYINGALYETVKAGALLLPITYQFPFLVTAVDPTQEDRLIGLRRATSGQPLTEGQTFSSTSFGSIIPIVVSSHSYLDEALQLTAAVVAMPRGSTPATVLYGPSGYKPPNGPNDAYTTVARLKSAPIHSALLPVGKLYPQVLHSLQVSGSNGGGLIQEYISASQVKYHRLKSGSLRPLPVFPNPKTFAPTIEILNLPAPIENSNRNYRTLVPYPVVLNKLSVGAGTLQMQGIFDPRRLAHPTNLAEVPLTGYYPPVAFGANAKSRRLLDGGGYGPTRNLGGLIAAPPLMLTTLTAARGFTSSKYFSGGNPAAPISAIRVRIGGVATLDRASELRISSVAASIKRLTGLTVDVVLGSSPAPQDIVLTTGNPSRVELTLRQGWSQKGAALEVLSSVNSKTVALIVLLLMVGCLIVVSAS
ncbi:MAG: hypothetical protein ACRDFS_12460, partial [Chloroflexota bacterium]